jgi:succinylglutamate desuccinylase
MQAYESRLKVMSEPLFFRELESETGWNEIKLAIRNSITAEKYQRVLQYFSYPLAIVSISDDILEDLNRVFNGRNANFSIQYPNKRAEAQATELLYNKELC